MNSIIRRIIYIPLLLSLPLVVLLLIVADFFQWIFTGKYENFDIALYNYVDKLTKQNPKP